MSVIYKDGKFYGGPVLPIGGKKGQVLMKSSSIDGDVVWSTPGIETSPEMEGADYWHDGEKGLVPKPLKSDVGKCLFGDGEWRNIYFSDAGSTVVVSTKVEELLGQTCTLMDFRSTETGTFVRNGDNIECVFQNIQMIGQCECTATDTNDNEYHGWVNMSYFGMYLVKFSEEYAIVKLVADDPSLEGQVVGIYTGTNYSTKLFDVILMSDGEGGCRATFDLDATGDYLAQVKENDPSGKGLCRAPFTVSALNTEQSVPIFFYHIYGYKVSYNSDPDACVTYYAHPEWGGENVGFTDYAHMDYVNDKFVYGSWKTEKFTPFFWPKPCLLGLDGSVNCYLNPNNLSQDIDGNSVDISSYNADGNVMVEFPTIYFKRWTEGTTMYDTDSATKGKGVCYCLISDHPLDESFKAYAHHDANGHVLKNIYLSAFPAIYDGTYARSLKGYTNDDDSRSEQTPVIAGKWMLKCPPSKAFEVIQANNQGSAHIAGEGWSSLHYADWIMVNDLLILISKSLNTQDKFGNGKVVYNSGHSRQTGNMSLRGEFYGNNASEYTPGVKVFNMEQWWGLCEIVLCGIMMATDTTNRSIQNLYIKMTYGTEDGSSVEGFNYFDHGDYDSRFIKTIPLLHPTVQYNGIPIRRYYCDYGFLWYPDGNLTNTSLYFCDTYVVNHYYGTSPNLSGNGMAFVGGDYNTKYASGAFRMYLYGVRTNTTYFTGDKYCAYMLSYKGLA